MAPVLRVVAISCKALQKVTSWYWIFFSLQNSCTSFATARIWYRETCGKRWCSICLLSQPNIWFTIRPHTIFLDVRVWRSSQEYSRIVFPSITCIPIWFTINTKARWTHTKIDIAKRIPIPRIKPNWITSAYGKRRKNMRERINSPYFLWVIICW